MHKIWKLFLLSQINKEKVVDKCLREGRQDKKTNDFNLVFINFYLYFHIIF